MSEGKPSLRETINRIREKGIEWPTPDEIMEGRERASTEHAALTARVAELEAGLREARKHLEHIQLESYERHSVEKAEQGIVHIDALLEQKP